MAFDGKTHRGVEDNKCSCLHMLNAWSVGNRLVQGQFAVEEKINEITATPKLMEMLELKDCISPGKKYKFACQIFIFYITFNYPYNLLQ